MKSRGVADAFRRMVGVSEQEDFWENAPAALPVTVDQVTVGTGTRAIISDVSLVAPEGKTTAVIGPNGSGKTTLLRALYRAWRPSVGAVQIGGRDVWAMGSGDAARLRSVVTQHQGEGVGFTGREIVEMGRYPHIGRWQSRTPRDDAVIDRSLEVVEAAQLGSKIFSEMSGGERQLILVARALAQESPVIILDEPTNHLDVRAQLSLLRLLSRTTATTLVAVHDVNHALAYADNVVVLRNGALVAAGSPEEVITPELLLEVFGVRASVTVDPHTGKPFTILGLPDDTQS